VPHRGDAVGPAQWGDGALSKAVDGCAAEGENRGVGGELTGTQGADDEGSSKWSWGLIKVCTRGENGATGGPCACARTEALPPAGTYAYAQRAVAGEAKRRVAERQGEVECAQGCAASAATWRRWLTKWHPRRSLHMRDGRAQRLGGVRGRQQR
jgi:hypothetical protein